MITAKKAKETNEFHAEGGCSITFGKRGRAIVHIERWRRVGQTRLKAKSPEFYEVPVMHGMWGHSIVRNGEEDLWHSRDDCKVLQYYQHLPWPIPAEARQEVYN